MDQNALELMLDEHAIRKVLELYTRGVDRLDAELVSSVYWPDSHDDHGAYKGPGQEFGPFVAEALKKGAAATEHSLNQSLIEIDGNRARAETYFVAYHRREEVETYLDIFGGRYMDVLEKRGEEWRLLDRKVIWEWSKTEKIKGSHYDPSAFEHGKRDKRDPAYDQSWRSSDYKPG
ncbi:MAG: nuclear transport factor 2 family protein [Alphaproteobacteria bacterium]|nr:nuclear transport factor 2 family protein [Alphaproteobacteria bacterium]